MAMYVESKILPICGVYDLFCKLFLTAVAELPEEFTGYYTYVWIFLIKTV